MKTRVMIAICVFTLLSCIARADNAFDITLEGPWIIYQYQNANLGGGKPVLVVVAPSAGGIFHAPNLSTGYGYILSTPTVYCLLWGTECAHDTGKSALSHLGGHPDAKFVPVMYPKANQVDTWNFVGAKKYGLFAFILPMPTSYTVDGAWNMRFAKKFDRNGNGYGNGSGADSEYIIGLQLHYDNGPSLFDLRQCADDLTCTTPVPIGAGYHTILKNTGTLRIVMKAPDTNDACDYHVRSLYRPMLYLLDDTKLSDGGNKNQNYGYIDPARTVDDQGHGDYADKSCFANDVQGNPESVSTGKPLARRPSKAQHIVQPAMLTIPTVGQQLEALIADIQKLDLKQGILEEIKANADSLEKDGAFPLSELTQLAESLNTAAAKARELNKTALADKLKKLAAVVQPKNGADCRAPLMLVQ
jgi:hypothetical protein